VAPRDPAHSVAGLANLAGLAAGKKTPAKRTNLTPKAEERFS